MSIIGFAGAAGSGKDTAAAHLTARGWTRIAFADSMREALYALDPHVAIPGGTYPLTMLVDRHGWDRTKQYPDVRRLLQRFGTEVGREMFGVDFWVDRALNGIGPDDRVVVTDVRFPNEADGIRARGGIVVRVDRPGAGLTGGTGAHASEAQAFSVDHVIVNDGGLDELHHQVASLLVPA